MEDKTLSKEETINFIGYMITKITFEDDEMLVEEVEDMDLDE